MLQGSPQPNRRDKLDRKDASQDQTRESVAAPNRFASSGSFDAGIKATSPRASSEIKPGVLT